MRLQLHSLILLCFCAATSAYGATPSDGQAVNRQRAELGRHLFFDKRLSGDWGMSCASCHNPMHGWSDGRALARGYSGANYGAAAPNGLRYFRNTPALFDVAGADSFNTDGHASSLSQSVGAMLTSAHFMHADSALVVERVWQSPQYRVLWKRAYGAHAQPSDQGVIAALSEFIRTLSPGMTPYDRYLRGEQAALSIEAQQGLALFQGKAGCIACHSGPRLSDGKFHRLGVPDHPDIAADPLRMMTMLNHYAALRMPDYMQANTDVGRYVVTRDEKDRGRFKTPGLRGLRYTGPYMHNGMLGTLDAVVDFYDRGGGDGAELKPLSLTVEEKKALVALLESMSGEPVRMELPQVLALALHPAVERKIRGKVRPALAASFPPLAPLPPVPVPPNNPMSAEKIALGKKLFWDGRLSGNGQLACVSCHLPALGWGDGQSTSRAYPGTKNWRNARTVLNAAYYKKLFWDGAADSLESQAPKAAHSPIEGHGDFATMEMRLRFIPEYVAEFSKVFGTEWPQISQAWQAIASYERTLVSDAAKVPFDRYMNGDKQALSQSALRGLVLFQGKANCITCHNGPLATDQKYHALGVPPSSAVRNDPLLQITYRWKQKQPSSNAVQLDDAGLYNLTRDAKDIGKFRTPSLRELKYTGPYMHNGVFEQLIDVVKFFNRGGGPGASALKPLGLSESEEKDLVAFLEALSMDQPLLDTAPNLPEWRADGKSSNPVQPAK
ncbi:MAG: hypothetical protein HYS18_07010 [Burkholderiales bacterium]|nr:hypothetical protein [Burkholderiales bacterium]